MKLMQKDELQGENKRKYKISSFDPTLPTPQKSFASSLEFGIKPKISKEECESSLL